jgi:hypothetical protein
MGKKSVLDFGLFCRLFCKSPSTRFLVFLFCSLLSSIKGVKYSRRWETPKHAIKQKIEEKHDKTKNRNVCRFCFRKTFSTWTSCSHIFMVYQNSPYREKNQETKYLGLVGSSKVCFWVPLDSTPANKPLRILDPVVDLGCGMAQRGATEKEVTGRR